jgi:chromosome segregation protein
MPLRLKSLELHGYKTFAARTNFDFAAGITAIVGPNGSGKSNIADALRWVLGEQAYSLLRAKKTEDMIFAGSELRPRSGMASAGIVFDNSDGWLPVDFSEVSISRRAYRDGRNEYLLNNQHVRLKDINELLAKSGLSERTYTILGQGLVDASLALKADERRRLFEEAAGIGLYRARREESLRRLEIAQRNLDRVLDILEELGPRLRSLERQAIRAQEYSRAQNELRALLHEWYGFHWHNAQKDLTEVMNLARNQETKLRGLRESYQNVRMEFSTFRERLNGARTQLNSLHRKSAQLYERREIISREKAMFDERHRSFLENRQIIVIENARQLEELKVALERLSIAEKEIVNLQLQYEEAQIQTTKSQTELTDLQAKRSSIESDLEKDRRKFEEINTQQAGLQARIDTLVVRLEDQKQVMESTNQAVDMAKFEEEKVKRELETASATSRETEKILKLAESKSKLAQEQLAVVEASVKQKQTELAAKQAVQTRYKTQLEVLEQAEQSLVGFADGAKLLLDAARKSNSGGAQGALSSVLEVPKELEVAISAALGEYIDGVLMNSGREAEAALALLDKNQSGRTSILPLDWIIPSETLRVKTDDTCLGVASDLVKVSEELHPVLDLLLGQVLVTRDRESARRVLASQPKNVCVVTLLGEVFHASGQVLAGKPAKTSVLGRPRQRRELQEILVDANQQINKMEDDLKIFLHEEEIARNMETNSQKSVMEKRATYEIACDIERQVKGKEEIAHRQLDWYDKQKDSLNLEIAQTENDLRVAALALSQNKADGIKVQDPLRDKMAELSALSLDEAQAQVTFWGTRLAVIGRALSDSKSRFDELKQITTRLQEEQTGLQSRLMEIEKSLTSLEIERESQRNQVAEINQQLEQLRNIIGQAENELEKSEVREKELQDKETEEQIVLGRGERTNAQIQLDLSRKQETLITLRQRIEDDFGLVAFEYATEVSGPVPLPLEGMVDKLPIVPNLPPDLEENMIRMRTDIRHMGAINPEAQEEFKSVKERHIFLTDQVGDLHKAEADLRHVIIELDEITRREFQKTFEAVADEFHVIFHRLFDGGSARLTLTDPDNISETGIDIEARLPGRREQGLSLLSGGERSLTAIALVFSLLKVSPTPFCVMDEVDAMLDETNVGRFRDLLQELSKETQFIIITHNRNTVQAADVIYGVTMGRDSGSQIISLKLDELSDEYLK